MGMKLTDLICQTCCSLLEIKLGIDVKVGMCFKLKFRSGSGQLELPISMADQKINTGPRKRVTETDMNRYGR